MTRDSGFRFIDLPTSADRLGTTRNQLLQWVAEGRIKPFSGSGQQSVFRAADVEELAAELGIIALAQETQAAPEPNLETAAEPQASTTTRTRRRDPIKLIGTRLSMDSRWAEITEQDIATWLDALEPMQFDRVRKVSNIAIESLQRLLNMLDEQEKAVKRDA